MMLTRRDFLKTAGGFIVSLPFGWGGWGEEDDGMGERNTIKEKFTRTIPIPQPPVDEDVPISWGFPLTFPAYFLEED